MPSSGRALVFGAILSLLAAPDALAAGAEAGRPSEARFLAALVVILIAARLLGEAMHRLAQPAVIGQLLAGVLLGPSFFGLLLPQAQHALFPDDAAQRNMLEAIGQFGVLLILLLTGMDTDMRLIRKVGRAAISVALMGVALPFLCGVAAGLLLPPAMIPRPEARLVTSLFLGVALSISSVKIVAMVVREMGFMRRDLGQIIVASAIIEDSIGWILVAVIFGVARAGSIEILPLARNVLGIALFLGLSLTIGRRVVAALIRRVNDTMTTELPVITLIIVIMGAMALTTYALGVQTVLGAFVAGVIIGESPILTKHIDSQLRGIVAAFFAPVFFALAGLSADLTILKSPQAAALTLGLIVIASIGKFAGAFAGGGVGRLSRRESMALAIGMNARGSTEVIVASVGLSLGVLSRDLYSMIVTMAVLTTMSMPPTLRWALSRLPLREGEAARLEREAFEARGFVDNMERLLVIASDGRNGRLASRIAGLLAGRRSLPTTVLPIERQRDEHVAANEAPIQSANALSENVRENAEGARNAAQAEAEASSIAVETRSARLPPESAVAAESAKGYDLLAIGLDLVEDEQDGFGLEITKTVRAHGGPLMVVIARGAHLENPLQGRLKILVPVTGTEVTRRAAEIGVEVARSADAAIVALYVASPHGGADAREASRRRFQERLYADAVLKDIVEIADHRDVVMETRIVVSERFDAAIEQEAKRARATLIVLGVSVRPADTLLFGNTAARLLEESEQSLAFVAS